MLSSFYNKSSSSFFLRKMMLSNNVIVPTTQQYHITPNVNNNNNIKKLIKIMMMTLMSSSVVAMIYYDYYVMGYEEETTYNDNDYNGVDSRTTLVNNDNNNDDEHHHHVCSRTTDYPFRTSLLQSFTLQKKYDRVTFMEANNNDKNNNKEMNKENDKDTDKENNDVRRLDIWKNRWITGNTRWHKDNVHPIIMKYYDTIFSDPNKKYNVLIPLCGKTLDMAYIATKTTDFNKNHHVVGIDVSNNAIQQFIQENDSLNIVKNDQPKDSLYDMYNGNNITLYCGDYFQLKNMNVVKEYNINNKFDVIWDRGSLVAIHPTLRNDYITILENVISYNNGVYILQAVVRGNKKKEPIETTGPPYHLSNDAVNELFGELPWIKSITILESKSMTYDSKSLYETFNTWYRFGFFTKEVTYYIVTKQPNEK